jgi:hypothetical protein
MAIFNRGSSTSEPVDSRGTTDPRTTTDTRTVDRERTDVPHQTRDPLEDRAQRAAIARENAYERFGGINWGASFFGWLVAVAVAVLLTSIVGAIVTAVGDTNNFTQTDAERAAGTISMAAGVTLMVVLALAYFTGGYVAGRMSRFDGAKQGAGAWIVGLTVTVLALLIGWLAGQQYNVFDRVDLPRIPLPSDQVSTGGLVVAIALLVLTLLSSMLGGKVGQRYHLRVDRAHTV